jgi:hypothetical protein
MFNSRWRSRWPPHHYILYNCICVCLGMMNLVSLPRFLGSRNPLKSFSVKKKLRLNVNSKMATKIRGAMEWVQAPDAALLTAKLLMRYTLSERCWILTSIAIWYTVAHKMCTWREIQSPISFKLIAIGKSNIALKLSFKMATRPFDKPF